VPTKRATFVTVGTTAVATIPLNRGTWFLRRLTQDRSAGAAATHQPYLSTDVTDTVPGTPIRGRIATATATAVATRIDEVPPQPVEFQSEGFLYVFPGFNAAADNSCITEVALEYVGGGDAVTNVAVT